MQVEYVYATPVVEQIIDKVTGGTIDSLFPIYPFSWGRKWIEYWLKVDISFCPSVLFCFKNCCPSLSMVLSMSIEFSSNSHVKMWELMRIFCKHRTGKTKKWETNIKTWFLLFKEKVKMKKEHRKYYAGLWLNSNCF